MGISHIERSSAPADYASLLAQRRQLDSRLAELRTEAIEQFKQRIMAEAQELEIDLIALLAPTKRRRDQGREAAEVRYRDPDNPTNTWSGRGRPPRWLQDHIDAGRDRDEFVIA